MFVTTVSALDDVIAVDAVVEQSHKLFVALVAVHHRFGFFVVGQVVGTHSGLFLDSFGAFHSHPPSRKIMLLSCG